MEGVVLPGELHQLADVGPRGDRLQMLRHPEPVLEGDGSALIEAEQVAGVIAEAVPPQVPVEAMLEMKVPHDVDWSALRPLGPVFATYVMSFIYLGIYWNNHHHMLHLTDTVNGWVLWANLHLLFWLSLIPFVTGWMGENHFAALPTALYGAVLLNARAIGEFGAVSVVSGHVRGLTNTAPLHVEILYNEYEFVAAFAVASVLALAALLSLAAKSIIESRTPEAS